MPTLAELEAELARRKSLSKYSDDALGFVRNCLTWAEGTGPSPYQAEILSEFPVRRRVAIRAPHGCGKTALAAWIALWFSLTRDGWADWKAPMTASAWRQLSRYLWPEIHKWARQLKWNVIGRLPFDPRTELLSLNLRLSTGEAFAVASDTPALIEGAHADQLLYVFDEAKAIAAATFDAAEGAFAGSGVTSTVRQAYALCISTPGEPVGRFYEIHARRQGLEDWWTRHITYDEGVAAGFIDETWAAQRARQWGPTSAVYQNRILGEFAASSEDAVIPLAWVEAANDRWRAWQESGEPAGELDVVGVDVARSGSNDTVLASLCGTTVTELRRYSGQDTMATTGQVVAILSGTNALAAVDTDGLGAGVTDRLRELGQTVFAFHANSRIDIRDSSGELGFVNLRSAAWWHLRELLDPGNGHAVALPPDEYLIGDLTTPKWRVLSNGRIEVESKDSLTRRLERGSGDRDPRRSTDAGDAVIQAFMARLLIGAAGVGAVDPAMEFAGGIPAEEFGGSFL